jgi:hypothetical protein
MIRVRALSGAVDLAYFPHSTIPPSPKPMGGVEKREPLGLAKFFFGGGDVRVTPSLTRSVIDLQPPGVEGGEGEDEGVEEEEAEDGGGGGDDFSSCSDLVERGRKRPEQLRARRSVLRIVVNDGLVANLGSPTVAAISCPDGSGKPYDGDFAGARDGS